MNGNIERTLLRRGKRIVRRTERNYGLLASEPRDFDPRSDLTLDGQTRQWCQIVSVDDSFDDDRAE